MFCILSEKLRSRRTPDQCRTHHLKQLSRHHYSVESIIEDLQSKEDQPSDKSQPQPKIKSEKESPKEEKAIPVPRAAPVKTKPALRDRRRQGEVEGR